MFQCTIKPMFGWETGVKVGGWGLGGLRRVVWAPRGTAGVGPATFRVADGCGHSNSLNKWR